VANLSELRVEPFTNSIGQVINPGDPVVAVTTGYGHSVDVITGKFEGVYYAKSDGEPTGGTRIGEVPVSTFERVPCEESHPDSYPETRYDYITRKSEPTGKFYRLEEHKTYRKSSLQLSRVYKIDTTLDKMTEVKL